MATTNDGTKLRRIERDIDVEKRLRKQKIKLGESVKDIDRRLDDLKQQHIDIRARIDGNT